MPRILIAECKQEVSTFNPVLSHYDDFRVVQGEAMTAYHRTVAEEIGGALSVFDSSPDVEVVPTIGASSITSGGVLAADDFARLSGEFIESFRGAGPVDAIYFCLHGAMQAEGENDPEGFLLQEARRIFGEDIPIVISLDLHGICTVRMLTHSNAAVVYHTYPHVDFFETGARAARVLLKILSGDVKPVTARVNVPALVRGDELITESGAIRECIDLAKQIEASESGLAAAMMWGNPFTDVPELMSRSIVVMDDDESTACEHALRLADIFWKHHEKMQVPLTSLTDAVRQAAEVQSGTVALIDAADATSSGASGDSNAILAELLRQNYAGSALIPVVDPAAVQVALKAGIGATITVPIGGALDRERFEPVQIEAQVRMLSDGKFRSESFGWHWASGDTAVLQSGQITLVVGTKPVSLFDRSWFYAHGQDPKRFDLVVVKSPHCEPQMFSDWCARVINVDAPGSTSANLKSLGHTICSRPLFPLDDHVSFEPQVKVFRR